MDYVNAFVAQEQLRPLGSLRGRRSKGNLGVIGALSLDKREEPPNPLNVAWEKAPHWEKKRKREKVGLGGKKNRRAKQAERQSGEGKQWTFPLP